MGRAVKIPKWERRLVRVANRLRGTPFRWGFTDCAMVSLYCLSAITGRDHWSRFIRQYSSPLTAWRYMRRDGITIGAYLDDCGLEPVRDGRLLSGDFLVYREKCAHVIVGDLVLSSNVDDGVYYGKIDFSQLDALRALRVVPWAV